MTFEPPAAPGLSGAESFDGLDASVMDFWRFAMNDLRINNVRGYLAEFLVVRAVGSSGPRVEWDPWDVTAPDGTRIEVKSTGFVQAWAQNKLSTPTFQVSAAYGWDAAEGPGRRNSCSAQTSMCSAYTQQRPTTNTTPGCFPVAVLRRWQVGHRGTGRRFDGPCRARADRR